jgi:hypothetical protein
VDSSQRTVPYKGELMTFKINNYNPLNQRPNYNPSDVDKSKLVPEVFTVMMDSHDIEHYDLVIVPDLLFAIASQNVEGIYLSEATASKAKA